MKTWHLKASGRISGRMLTILALLSVTATAACDRAASTAISAPTPVYKGTTADAQVSREPGRLRIRVKRRQHPPPVTVRPGRDSTVLDHGRDPQTPGAASRVLPGTVVMFSEAGYDTAIVAAGGSGALTAQSTYFDVTASLTASVYQGQSWWPLARAANGYEVDVYVSGVNGSTPYGRSTRCLVGSVWGALQPCMASLSGHNTYRTSTNIAVNVGQACSYNARLNTVGLVGWYHNFDRVEGNRSQREIEVHDYKSSEIKRRCLPDISEVCDDPDYCSGAQTGGATGGPSATVEGEVEWQYPLAEGSAWRQVVVCDVTDWYVWTGSGWSYTDTTIDQCWVERR
jgi:hypothetical protein